MPGNFTFPDDANSKAGAVVAYGANGEFFFVPTAGLYQVQDATIALNGTESTEIDFRRYKYLAFQMPAAWTAAGITIKGSATQGGAKQVIKNESGFSIPEISVAANEIYTIDTSALMLSGIHFLALVSSVQQAAERVIKVMCKA